MGGRKQIAELLIEFPPPPRVLFVTVAYKGLRVAACAKNGHLMKAKLFVAKGFHGVDGGGAANWEETSQDGGGDKD